MSVLGIVCAALICGFCVTAFLIFSLCKSAALGDQQMAAAREDYLKRLYHDEDDRGGRQ